MPTGAPVQDQTEHAPELHLLVDWDETRRSGSWIVRLGLASVVLHVLFGSLGLYLLATAPVSLTRPYRQGPSDREIVTPLIAPPAQLTQRTPNKAPLSPEFNLESIAPRPPSQNPRPPGAASLPRSEPIRKFNPPTPKGVNPTPSLLPEIPALDTTALRPTAAMPQGLGTNPTLAPPKTDEKPKLAFENPGSPTGTAGERGMMRLPPKPKSTVDEAIRDVARGAGGGAMVGDEEGFVAGSAPGIRSPLPGKLGSNLELLSDPMGVDFRPYMMRVLATVRRNWFAVIPESARLGQTGRVAIQFAIDKEGKVPKLVISMPSGREPLDRAAVAGISASNPFPPLPADFKGGQIRLQLVFRYNLQR